MLTGKHPFEGETSHERLQRMLDPGENVLSPRALRQCPRALSDAVMRALERDPARRFQTMGAFARALEQAVPEIAKPACRDELAELSRSTVGDATRKRREAVARAIQVADARASEPPRQTLIPDAGDEEIPSLPSNMLMELSDDADDAPPALQTARPVAYTPAAMPTRKKLVSAGLAATAVIGAISMMLLPSIGRERALSARTPAAAQPMVKSVARSKAGARASVPETPQRKRLPQNLKTAAAPIAASLASAVTEPEPPAEVTEPGETSDPAAPPAERKEPWLLEPGF
jgi:hypothetical protein